MKSQPKRSPEVNEEMEFRALLDSANDLIFILSPDARFVYANQAFENALGYTVEELRALGIFDLLHPSCLEKCRQHFEDLRKQGAPPPALSTEFITKDGRTIIVEGNCSGGSRDHQPGVVRGIFRDITERDRAQEALRRSEERFRSLIEHSHDAISLFGPDGAILYASPSTTLIMGYLPEDLRDRGALEFVRPDWQDAVRDRLAESLRNPGVGIPTEGYVRHKDGQWRFLEGVFTNLLHEPSVGAIVNNYRDITERKLTDENLRTSREQLRALSARLQSAREEEGSRIAREIHDELGGALTGLKWDLEGIEKVLSGAGNEGAFASVREKIPSMTGLIESTINTVRRISSELRPGVLDDLGLVAAIEWQAQQFQLRTGIPCECLADLDVVDWDRDRAIAMFRILQEILTNVIRHAQATRVVIELQEHHGHVELRVSDNGRGITEEEMRNTHSLGLLGMRERALLAGGEVSVSGEPGRGTTVIARVPVKG